MAPPCHQSPSATLTKIDQLATDREEGGGQRGCVGFGRLSSAGVKALRCEAGQARSWPLSEVAKWRRYVPFLVKATPLPQIGQYLGG
jgi:hypothetical protein